MPSGVYQRKSTKLFCLRGHLRRPSNLTPRGNCIDCSRERAKEWYMENPKVVALRAKEWNAANPEKFIASREKWSKDNQFHKQEKAYGITKEMYEAMLIEQEFSCAICRKHQSEFKKILGIDHCHTTGKIRGLLCNSCNLMLGNAKDSIELLEKSIAYLKDSNEH